MHFRIHFVKNPNFFMHLDFKLAVLWIFFCYKFSIILTTFIPLSPELMHALHAPKREAEKTDFEYVQFGNQVI